MALENKNRKHHLTEVEFSKVKLQMEHADSAMKRQAQMIEELRRKQGQLEMKLKGV